ncbi:exonuclease RecJ [Halobacteriales archaeon QS_1_68_20]|nr:MAG: exonuclease RecJ [Halobacteriales archaeon QS_1_68_20]
MSTTGRPAEAAPADSVAAAVRDAGFVRIVARADGDALAATGLLAGALRDAGVPFQAGVARTDGDAARRFEDADGHPLAVGVDAPDATTLARDDGPASATAFEVARELGTDPGPVLALAGAFAAGQRPGEGETAHLLEAATEADRVERRPGVVVPTADLADGLAHSTLVHAGFSGRPDNAEELVADARAGAEEEADDAATTPLETESGRRRLASLVAVETAGGDDATGRAALAIERTLCPHATPDGPFATVGGYADVLGALAAERPGAGVALALGGDSREAALDTWRDHAKRAHEGLREATTGRYDGLFVARVADAPVGTTARLLADFRSPEPAALVVTDGEAAVVAHPDVAAPTDPLRAATASLGGDASVGPRDGYAAFDGDADAFVTAFREEA